MLAKLQPADLAPVHFVGPVGEAERPRVGPHRGQREFLAHAAAAVELHGAGGVSQVFKLASMYAHQRTLRLADGPDEVHRDQVGRLEIAKYN